MTSFLDIGNIGTAINDAVRKRNFGIKVREKFFYEPLLSLLNGGKPIDRAIADIADEYEKRGIPSGKVIREIHLALMSGKSFSDAVAPWVPTNELVFLSAGERSGAMTNSVSQLLWSMEAANESRKTLKEASLSVGGRYLLLFFVLAFLSYSIIPELLRSIELKMWPDYSQVLFACGNFILHYGVFLGAFMAVGFAYSLHTLPTWTGPIRERLDKIPATPWYIYRVYTASNLLIALASLVKSGMPVDSAVEKMRDISPPYQRQYLSTILARMRAGIDSAKAMEVHIFDQDTTSLISIHSKGAEFHRSIESVGKDSIKHSRDAIAKQTATLKMISNVLFAIFVGAFYMSVITMPETLKKQQQAQARGIIK